ncbi:MAG TPA: hypothetical protein VFA99_10000 [Acidobacteriaceae bacterium]|nr:hypothetical protein [Acidobacteriaceae bacterium]
MGRSAVVEHEDRFSETTPLLESDERWQVAKRAVASRHFARSPLLSNFLLYIVAETIQGRSDQITEHEIGVHVFDRPAHYRTLEDNIVRSYARQLRRRLTDYFLQEGSFERLHIEIPLGGYIPIFVNAGEEGSREAKSVAFDQNGSPHSPPIISGPLGSNIAQSRWTWRRSLLLLAYTAAICSVAWWTGRYKRHEPVEPAQLTAAKPLWDAIFNGSYTTYIVPADAGLNIIEDISHKPLPLAQYVNGDYAKSELPQVDPHSATDLRTQDFTSFVDLQIISALSRLPQFNPKRAILRFPRDIRLDDLKNANAIILGSVGSNPWAGLGDSKANFRIVYHDGMGAARIVNTHPLAGEMPEYVSHWNEPAHETFALISFLPSLSGDGHLLLVQGLDVAGTQAAGEALLRPELIEPILKKAIRPDGTLRNFEILLRASSIESSATGTSIISTRIY